MKYFIYYIFTILLFVACNENKSKNSLDNLKYSHYDIQLKIDPNEQFIKVTGSLKLLIGKDSLDQLSFYLHKQFVISTFSINGKSTYHLDTSSTNIRWLPDAMKIVYETRKKFYKGDILNILFSYEGKITQWPAWSANVIGPDWVEIGSYFPWYPSINAPFTYKLSVDIKPAYHVFAIGKVREKDNKRIFETNFPVDDFIICASQDLKVRNTKLLNHSFQIVNCTLSETTVDTIQTYIQHYYQLYTKWFGEIEVQDMCLVISKRDKGGGYSRKGGLFLGGVTDSSYLDNRTDYIRYIGHEIAHFWWHGAGSNWEDWLNESFAEYSAMMLIRELVSKEEFNSRLSKKRSEIINTPPVWGLGRNSSAAQLVLYCKGAVLLNELEEKIGNDRFLKLCQARINKNINNSQDFLNLLNDREGKEIKEWFEQSLKTK